LPNLVCADDTAQAAETMATARRKAALDAIAVGAETEKNATRECAASSCMFGATPHGYAWYL
jgi:hypothetical protein